MSKDEALKLALDWLESGTFVYPTALSTAIKEALAQPEQPQQEPVATVIKSGVNRTWMSEALGQLPDGTYSLYTTPPAQREWVGLTDAETEHLWEISRAAMPRYHTFKTLIEKALRERNT